RESRIRAPPDGRAMTTPTPIRIGAALVLTLAAALVVTCGGRQPQAVAKPAGESSLDLDGDASSGLVTTTPNDAVQAAFTASSYAPGSTAVLRLRGTAPVLSIRLFHAGAAAGGPLQGAPIGAAQTLRHPSADVKLMLGSWPSGLYYASVTTPGRGVWYAPFIL